MGVETYSRTLYSRAKSSLTTEGEPATFRGAQKVRETGKLDPLVDPAEYGVIRPSRIRLTERKDGLHEVSVGTPLTIEYRLDTTGSMGDNVDRALKALPQICELTASIAPGRDPFYLASIFGDIVDQFVLCRGQFEVLADRMVNQLTLMHPEGAGGDAAEDPHYGLFGAAYLTNTYLARIGLKSYDFTITDAPCHERLSENQLIRIFGKEVFSKVKENGYQISESHLPSNQDVVSDLLKHAHAFCLLVDGRTDSSTSRQWREWYGKDRVIHMPKIEFLPHVMAVITGLTEGTLDLKSAVEFLTTANLKETEAETIVNKVAHIPLGAQCALPNFAKMPKKGDLFASKTDLWPVDPSEITLPEEAPDLGTSSGGWL